MKTNTIETARPKFAGFAARLTTGEHVYVVNSNTDKGTVKILDRIYAGCAGWSGGAHPQYRYANARWVNADMIA
jgi:hypothetical protein